MEIRVSGGNLFEIAAAHLGDALQWINIARFNDLEDPFIEGLKVLALPAYSSKFSDGIGPQ